MALGKWKSNMLFATPRLHTDSGRKGRFSVFRYWPGLVFPQENNFLSIPFFHFPPLIYLKGGFSKCLSGGELRLSARAPQQLPVPLPHLRHKAACAGSPRRHPAEQWALQGSEVPSAGPAARLCPCWQGRNLSPPTMKTWMFLHIVYFA